MKRFVGSMLVATALLYGCGENSPPTGEPRATMDGLNSGSKTASGGAGDLNAPVALVKGEPLSMRQLVQPLIEAHGLTFLLNLVELEVAKQQAADKKIVVTQKDFDDEHEAMLEKLFKNNDDARLSDALERAIKDKREGDADFLRAESKRQREEVFQQFLANQHIDPVEFDIVTKITTYLRKIAEPQLAGLKNNEPALRRAFGQMYGERMHARYIQLANMDEVGQAKRRLAAGEPFEAVARDMSHDLATAALGGELRTFTRASINSPLFTDAFKDTAFALKDGQVSEVVSIGNSFDLIQRIRVDPPRAVEFETERPIVYRTLYNAQMDVALKELKQKLAVLAREQMRILEPVLAKQFNEKLEGQVHATEKAKEALAREDRLRTLLKLPHLNMPITQPSPGLLPAKLGTAPTAAPAAVGERPPATRPAPVRLPPPAKLAPAATQPTK